MLLKNYKSAMDSWTGRVDSTTDADAFRWHQQVRQLDLNREKVRGAEGLAFGLIGFCSDQGVRRNKGRPGAAEGPDAIRSQMASLPWGFTEQVCLYAAGNICCGDDITLEEGHRQLAAAVEAVLGMGLFPIVLGGGHETTFGHFEGQWAHLKKKRHAPAGHFEF